ncbi:MAG TPA: hypothetical protein VGB69_11810, partial [Edaphobacter sp.]
SYTLLQQLVSVGTLVGTGQVLALLSDGTTEFHLHAPLQGLVVEWFAQSGEPIDPEAALARIVAEAPEQFVPSATPVKAY